MGSKQEKQQKRREKALKKAMARGRVSQVIKASAELHHDGVPVAPVVKQFVEAQSSRELGLKNTDGNRYVQRPRRLNQHGRLQREAALASGPADFSIDELRAPRVPVERLPFNAPLSAGAREPAPEELEQFNPAKFTPTPEQQIQLDIGLGGDRTELVVVDRDGKRLDVDPATVMPIVVDGEFRGVSISSTAPLAAPELALGQCWEDCDVRAGGRKVVILELADGDGRVEVRNLGGKRTTRVKASEFRYGVGSTAKRGFRFVSSEAL